MISQSKAENRRQVHVRAGRKDKDQAQASSPEEVRADARASADEQKCWEEKKKENEKGTETDNQ